MKSSSKSHLKHSSESSYACDPLCDPRLTFTHEKRYALVDTKSKIASAVHIPVRALYTQQWSLPKKQQMVCYDWSALWVSIGNSDGRHMPNDPRLRAPNSSLIATYLFSNARYAKLPLLAGCTSCTLFLGWLGLDNACVLERLSCVSMPNRRRRSSRGSARIQPRPGV